MNVGLDRAVSSFVRIVLILGMALLASCGGGGSPTSISVNPKSLGFTGTPQSTAPLTQRVTAGYNGAGVVAGFAPGVDQPAWLGVNTVDSAPGAVTFAISAYPGSLAPGTYTVNLRFVTGLIPSNAQSIDDATNVVFVDLPITLTIVNLSVDKQSIALTAVDGGALPGGSFMLNIDSGKQWTASSNASWLTVQPSGTGPSTVNYAVNASGLSLGTNMGVITAMDSSGHSVEVSVTVTVAMPDLTTTPTAFTFDVAGDTSDAALSQALDISDDLGGANSSKKILWSVQSIDAAWLSVTPTSGSTAPSARAFVKVLASSLATMPNNTYSANVTLAYTTEDGQKHTRVVTVTLHLHSPLANILVTPRGAKRLAGQTPEQYVATGTYADGYVQNVTSQVTWSSSNPSISSVSNTADTAGAALPLSVGTANITATMPGTTVTNAAPFTVTPSVGAAYGLVYGNAIAQYVFGSDGVLQPMAATSAETPGETVQDIVFAPSGKAAYVTVNYSGGAGSNRLYQYDVDAHGSLTLRAAAAGNFSPYAVAVDHAGKYLYAADCCNSDVIAQYSIGADGTVSSSGNADVATTNVPSAIVMDSSSSYAYVTESEGGELWQYSVGPGGKLTRVDSGIIGTGSDPIDFVIHTSGKYAYAINNNNGVTFQHGSISQYAIGAGGVPTPLAVPMLVTEHLPRQMVIEPTGKYAYVINDDIGDIFEYSIGSDGSLSQFGEIVISSYDTGFFRGVALDPVGGFLYATNGLGAVLQYTIGNDGTLTLLGTHQDSFYAHKIIVRRFGN